MRVWQERARLVRAASAARRRPPAAASLLTVSRPTSVGPLAVAPQLSHRSRHDGQLQLRQARAFSFRSKFPVQDESAVVALEDELEEDKTSPKLVCGSCNSPLSRTKDLVFIKWKNGIHLSSTSDAPLERLRSKDTWDGEGASWKTHKLHCLKCGFHVGTLARVFSSEKILFSASRVSIQMPENQSPLMSFSGYPSSLLGFSMWSELILMAEAQPSLKAALQIRRVDKIRDITFDRKQINRKLLMAKDLRELLRLVDDNSLELNDVNIRTAIDRAARFVWTRSTRANLVSVDHDFTSASEAPEDQLMLSSLPKQSLPFPGTIEADEVDRKRFFKLVDMTENLVTFGVTTFKRGYDISSVMNSLMRLGIGRESILSPIAKQMMFMVNSGGIAINPNDASLIATAIVNLVSKDQRREPWVLEVLHASKDIVLTGTTAPSVEGSAMKASPLEILIPLVRAFATAEEFDEALFSRLFDSVAAGALEREGYSPYKRKALSTKIYQLHLDCLLQQRSPEFRLPSQIEPEFLRLFAEGQRNTKGSSFRMHHLVASALQEMGVTHNELFTLPEGYCLDFAMPKHRIGIEINASSCYQAAPTELGVDDDRPLGFVDFKARHLEQLGWVVIQLHAERFQALSTLEERVAYLSMLLEVAMARRRQSGATRPRNAKRKP